MKKKKDNDIFIKAFKRANRMVEFDRNGGGQFVSVNRPHKNKKKYDRKQNKKELSNQTDNSFLFYYIHSGFFFQIDVTLSTPNKATVAITNESANAGVASDRTAQ